jgi:hypothetical protein
MTFSDYRGSNLEKGCDLVVAITAKAINIQMLKYLKSLNNEQPVELWYKKTGGRGQETSFEVMQPIKLNKGIFEMSEDDAVPQQLIDTGFSFAVRAGFGVPSGLKQEYENVIGFSYDSLHGIDYNLFFHTFEIIKKEVDADGYYFNNVKQPVDDPVVFQLKADLNFDRMDPESKFYKGLSKTDKDRLKNLNTNQSFSVKQLYLDLNTAQLQTVAVISDELASSIKDITRSNFINTSWETFFGKAQVVLGYATTTNVRKDPASLQPTDLQFIVSPYQDQYGHVIDNPELLTLNYLMSCEGRRIPQINKFTWNWVEVGEASKIHGAMAIRRQEFAEFLAAALSPHLPNLCIKPTIVSFDTGAFSWSASSRFDKDYNPGPIKYTEGGTKTLIFNYTKQDKRHIKKEFIFDSLAADAHYELNSSASMSVELKNDGISIKVNGSMYVKFDPGDAFDGGNVDGRVGSYSGEIILAISVTPNGQLKVSLQYEKNSVKGTDFDKGIMASIDGSSSFIGKVADRYADCTNWVGSFTTSVEKYLNNTGNQWVFPGGQTFKFMDACFSEHQDLVAHIEYC